MIATIEKPCIKKCNLNEDEVCLGCFRTFKDMCQWHKATVEVKEIILVKAKERCEEYSKKK